MNKPFAIIQDARTSLQNKTGSWRTVRPVYVDKLPPCNLTCPAGENIQKWLSLAQEKKFREAWEVMVQDNPFPATMGRVCYHTCEKACNRSQFDGSVNINLLERSIGDIALREGWKFGAAKSENNANKKILIIGAGPSGLAAAYFLKKFGYGVTIYESHQKPGGTMRYGIPRYRLPIKVLEAEIDRILSMGVEIVYNKYVENLKDEIAEFAAVYISTGAYLPIEPKVDIVDKSSVISALDLFRTIEDNPSALPNLGDTVLVYGGGNSAIDAARTARRLGAKNVKIVYRRKQENMPAHVSEIEEALAEGVEILTLRTINKIEKGKITLDKMLYENDVLSKSGETEIVAADSVIFAIGQAADTEVFAGIEDIKIIEGGVIDVDKNLMTGHAGIFAGGDIINGKRTVTHAIGAGKRAAKSIDAYVRGVELPAKNKHEVAGFKNLNTEYFKKNPKKEVSRLGELNFEEKNISYDNEKIVQESARCFSCGNCFHCDNCYGYCPDNAIIKHEDGTLEFNYEYCKGCGICASECPCGAIKMVPNE